MERIEPPRPVAIVARPVARRDAAAPEPSTGRALWPTFMRRTLEDERVRPRPRDAAEPR